MQKIFLKKLFILVACMSVAVGMYAHELPQHRAYDWCRLSIQDMKGEFRVPVIFVNFEQKNSDNENVVSETNQASWMKRLNDAVPANHMGEKGSVSDFFAAQSYGALEVTFDNIGTYTAPGRAADYADYGKCAQMVRQAVSAQTGTAWSRYDKNGDGEVDCLLLIYAGHCDGDMSTGNIEISSIYPHRSWMTLRTGRTAQTSDANYVVQNYVLINDLRDGTAHTAAINTVCHELGHGLLDLNDHYSGMTSYMGQYDMMCYGFRQTAYSAADNHCCDMTAFDRMYLGWLDPLVLDATQHVHLQPLSLLPDACVIVDPANANHLFVLENRARMNGTWDAHLPQGGLLLTEVRYNRGVWENHNVNTGITPNMRLIEASTSRGVAIPNAVYLNTSQSGIPYGVKGRNEIAAEVNAIFATHRVTNITVNADQSIDFDFVMATDGVVDMACDERGSNGMYDVAGRRAGSCTMGIVIDKNGKKIINRK